jgi:hypothetical protein
MSEADRIFSARKGQGAQAPLSGKRLIISTPRKGGLGGKSRVVEVVHVRRDRSRPIESRLHTASWNAHAETWPEGFRSKPAQPIPPLQDMQPTAPEPAPPVVHVMPMWEPSPQQPAQRVAEPGEPSVEAAARVTRRPRIPKATTRKVAALQFADPFADGDDGTNCMRCGYLVEPAREKRGLLTCLGCG